METLMHEPDETAVAPRRSPRTRRNALLIAAAVIGVAAVAVVVVRVGSAKPTGSPSAPAQSTNLSTNPTANWPDIKLMSATQVWDLAANLSVGAVDQPVRPGQFRYVNQHTWVMNTMQTGDKTGYSYVRVQLDVVVGATGSHGPVVNSWVSTSRRSMPCLVAVDR
ncbi:hypothetical protein [Amycolatopsis sp. NPDC051061]|uniref:hypothetical protein n=1 Tax=Amycolatopsis sp. NPDC051061 TaxID=3155042 RepID=UPI00344359B1